MSVVVQNQSGWVLDPCGPPGPGLSPRDQELQARFRRRRPYGANPPNNNHHNNNNNDNNPPGPEVQSAAQDSSVLKHPRKRKRKHVDLNQGEIDALAYHEKVRSFILEGTKGLVEAARPLGYLEPEAGGVGDPREDEPLPRWPDCNLAALCDMAKQLPLVEEHGGGSDDDDDGVPVQFLPTEGVGGTSHLDLFSRVTENSADSALEVTLMGADYIIPPRSAFLLSDFTRIQPLVHYGKKFDLMVLDPPWENKSVKRSGRYSSLPSSQLKQLPVPLLAAPGCLVVTWVTNKPRLLRFVRDQLYPHWGVRVVAEWLWVKVTTAGEFVFPLDSPHKKPYEVLLLGRCTPPAPAPPSPPHPPPASHPHPSAPPPPSAPHPPSDPRSPEPHGRSQEESSTEDLCVAERRLVVSVPSVFHSQKPPLAEVLRPYVGPGARCLELFARGLQPGWTSWGNEVIKFQHAAYHHLTPDPPPAHQTPPPAHQTPPPPL